MADVIGGITVEVLDAFADAFNRHDADAVVSYMTEDCVFEAYAGPDICGTRYLGREAVRAAFPDAQWSDAQHFIEGSRGVSEWTFTGTRVADGARVEVHGCDLFTFRDGKIAVKNSYRRTARPGSIRLRSDDMDEKSLFTNFWTKEARTTRNVLARIPEGSQYRPDPKSRTAQDIAWQILCEERMLIDALENGTAEWTPTPPPAAMMEIVQTYEQQSASIAERLASLPEAKWLGTLEFFGKQRPAAPMAWSFLFDIVHHRGQITTYLRPMGSTVPQIYGPSADEP